MDNYGHIYTSENSQVCFRWCSFSKNLEISQVKVPGYLHIPYDFGTVLRQVIANKYYARVSMEVIVTTVCKLVYFTHFGGLITYFFFGGLGHPFTKYLLGHPSTLLDSKKETKRTSRPNVFDRVFNHRHKHCWYKKCCENWLLLFHPWKLRMFQRPSFFVAAAP